MNYIKLEVLYGISILDWKLLETVTLDKIDFDMSNQKLTLALVLALVLLAAFLLYYGIAGAMILAVLRAIARFIPAIA